MCSCVCSFVYVCENFLEILLLGKGVCVSVCMHEPDGVHIVCI